MNVPQSHARSRHYGAEHEPPTSDLQRLFQLSMTMFESLDQEHILRLALASVATLSTCRGHSGFLARAGKMTECLPEQHPPANELADQLDALRGDDGSVTIPGTPWAQAFVLRPHGGVSGYGYLVVTGEAELSAQEGFLLHALAQQTAAALANAAFHRVEREQALQLSRLTEELAATNQRLRRTVEDLHQRQTITDTFADIVASDGDEDEIATALHRLTGRTIAIEDRFGNLLSRAGPGKPASHRSNARRESILRNAATHHGVAHERDHLLVLVQPQHEILGVIILFDPGTTADPNLVYALEHGSMALALRLRHARNLAEVELRLRRDLVEDLLTGMSDQSVFARSEAVGHDLRPPHYAAALQWLGGANEDVLATAVAKAARKVGMSVLLARRTGMVVLFSSCRPDADAFYRAVSDEMGSVSGAIGIGGRCGSPDEFPRSFDEAMRALRIRQQSRPQHGITFFDELGIYRLLSRGERGSDIKSFVREWLGPLLDYDVKHQSNLVRTLSQYLECGGNYNATASLLVIHRSTLRYRLRRIREISHIEINDVDNRLNLHIATRAWQILDGAR